MPTSGATREFGLPIDIIVVQRGAIQPVSAQTPAWVTCGRRLGKNFLTLPWPRYSSEQTSFVRLA